MGKEEGEQGDNGRRRRKNDCDVVASDCYVLVSKLRLLVVGLLHGLLLACLNKEKREKVKRAGKEKKGVVR